MRWCRWSAAEENKTDKTDKMDKMESVKRTYMLTINSGIKSGYKKHLPRLYLSNAIHIDTKKVLQGTMWQNVMHVHLTLFIECSGVYWGIFIILIIWLPTDTTLRSSDSNSRLLPRLLVVSIMERPRTRSTIGMVCRFETLMSQQGFLLIPLTPEPFNNPFTPPRPSCCEAPPTIMLVTHLLFDDA